MSAGKGRNFNEKEVLSMSHSRFCRSLRVRIALALGLVFVASPVISAQDVHDMGRYSIRLAYPIAFLCLSEKASRAKVDFELIDTNDYKGADVLTLSVWGPRGEFVRRVTVPDDGITTPAHKRTGPRRVSVEFPVDAQGAFQVCVEGTSDLRISPATPAVRDETSRTSIALWARRVFWVTPPKKLYVAVGGQATIRTAVMAYHRNLITLEVRDSTGRTLAMLKRDSKSRTRVAEFDVPSEGILEFNLRGEMFQMELTGVEVPLCLTRRDAEVFRNALAHQAQASLEEMLAKVPAKEALDMVRCGDAESEEAHQLEIRESIVVKRGSEVGRKALGGFFAYRIAVDPQAQNYITFALDGREVGTIPWRNAWPGLPTVRRGYRFVCDNVVIDQPINADVPLPLSPTSALYLTYPIPRDVTAGKSRVRIAIEAIGNTETATVFGIWTHTDACWRPLNVKTVRRKSAPTIACRWNESRLCGQTR